MFFLSAVWKKKQAALKKDYIITFAKTHTSHGAYLSVNE